MKVFNNKLNLIILNLKNVSGFKENQEFKLTLVNHGKYHPDNFS